MDEKFYNIEPLSDFHDKKFFDCGVEPLNDYLKTLANQHQSRNISRTFVMTAQQEKQILGYYTLAMGQLHHFELPSFTKHPRYPVAIARLARLAVDSRLQKKGLGQRLLHDALKRIFIISKTIGVFAVVVDAKDHMAIDFYQQFGFLPLEKEPTTLFLLMKTLSKLFEHMNDEIAQQESAQRMKQTSLLAREESMRVNAEFSEIDHDPNV